MGAINVKAFCEMWCKTGSITKKMPLNLATPPTTGHPANSRQRMAEQSCLAISASGHSNPLTFCTCSAPTFTSNHLLLGRMIPRQQPRTTERMPIIHRTTETKRKKRRDTRRTIQQWPSNRNRCSSTTMRMWWPKIPAETERTSATICRNSNRWLWNWTYFLRRTCTASDSSCSI